jgi:hypothetical protein
MGSSSYASWSKDGGEAGRSFSTSSERECACEMKVERVRRRGTVFGAEGGVAGREDETFETGLLLK